jgi:type II secretory pathway pseudopilin PulG
MIGEGSQGGFTYPLVLVTVVVLGITASAAQQLISRQVRAERERELLFRGMAYVAAIASYYEAGMTVKTMPRNLEDLERDPRHVLKRHIRRLYPDPIGGGEWTLLRDGAGGIRGVASTSTSQPLRRARFPLGLEAFETAETYADWRFEFHPEAIKHTSAWKTQADGRAPSPAN